MIPTWGATRGTSAVGFVTAVEVLNDFSIPITVPSALSIPMQTNGSCIKITTSGTDLYAAVDLTKVTVSVTDMGHDASGNQVAKARTITLRSGIYGPYNEATIYQPVAGQFIIKCGDLFFNQDATWKTTVVSVNFQAGWIAGKAAQTFAGGSVTRSDTLTYPAWPMKTPSAPWSRVATGETFAFEVCAAHPYPFDNSEIACVEAWAVDSLSNVGTTVRSSTFARSANTPNNATLPGLPAPTYALAVSPAGLTAGRCEVRFRVKPWIGPPQESATVGSAYPTLNTPIGVPFCYDTDGSYAPLYGNVVYDPAATPPGFVRLIASNTNVATVDVSGLSTTKAGAIASGIYYADFATVAIAAKRVNQNAGPFTILDAAGTGTQSYARTTLHTDVAGGVAVFTPVAGSVLGADLGCYSNRINSLSLTTFAPGLVAFEITSTTGLPTVDVRIRGRNSGGGATASKNHMNRMRLRGIIEDSTGVTTAADNIVFDGGATNGAPAVAVTEAAAVCVIRIDCEVRNTTATSPGTASVAQRQSGWVYDTRVAIYDSPGTGDINQGAGTFAGLAGSIGCLWSRTAALTVPTLQVTWPGCLLGVKMVNVGLVEPATTIVKPPIVGTLLYNADVNNTNATTPLVPVRYASAVPYPITGGFGVCNLLVRADTNSATSVGAFNLFGDGMHLEVDCAIVHGVTAIFKNAANTGVDRANILYNEQGWIRINKRAFIMGLVSRAHNIKGDTMVAPETAAGNGDGDWTTLGGSATAFAKGTIVTDAGTGYQAVQTVPAGAGIILSNTTYWYNGGSAVVAYNQQSLRQGNSDIRYHVGSTGIVASTNSNADPTPGATSWYGNAWGPNDAYGQTVANYFVNLAADNYAPAPAGPLVSKVPAGRAYSPIDAYGTALANDGTGAAGAIQ